MQTAGLVVCLALAGAAAAVEPPALPAQQADSAVLVVHVTDAVTGQPVVNALIAVPTVEVTALTDSTGAATIRKVPPGSHVLAISAPGYAEQRVSLGFSIGEADAYVQLAPAPVPLAPVHVAGAGREPALVENGFYERERIGGGTFIRGEQLDRVAARSGALSDLFRTVPGFRVSRRSRGGGRASVWSTRGCSQPPALFLDGARQLYTPTFDFNAVAPLGLVRAVEAYPGNSSVPPQYGGGCGAILIWLRHGPRK